MENTFRKQGPRVLNMNSLSKRHWQYVMGILDTMEGTTGLAEVCHSIIDDPNKEPDFKNEVILALMACPSSEMR